MACATATHPATENWTAVFPKEVNSSTGSSLFMKKIVAIAVSAITYMRDMFPESAYGNRKSGDMNLKILSERSSCAQALQVIDWVKSAFDALEKKYLRIMMIGVHDKPGDHDNVIESYIFHFNYTKGVSVTCNGVEISNSTDYDVKVTRRATITLFRTLLLLNHSLDPLPDNYYVTMKLLYYDDVTPSDYEPTGFVPADTDAFYFNGEPFTVRVGSVSTPFHSFKLNVKSNKKRFDFQEEEPMPSASIQLQSSGRTQNMDTLGDIADRKDPVDEEDECQIVDPSNYTSLENGINTARSVAENTLMRCPCGSVEDEGLMVQCCKCGYWQHCVCFGVIEEAEAPVVHLCDICYRSDNDGFEPKDKDFYELSPISMKALCLWRQALLYVCGIKLVQPTVLARSLQTQRCVAANIVKRMEDEGYVTVTGEGRGRVKRYPNKSLIMEHGFPKYILGTVKDISDDNDVTVELNEESPSFHAASFSDITTYGLFGHGKGKYQDFKTSDSEGHGCDRDGTQKYKKASTCKDGFTLYNGQN